MADTTPHNFDVSEQIEDRRLSERWPELNDDDWAHLPIIRPGASLDPGKVYFDLNHPERGTFKALGRQEATDDNRFIGKDELDPTLWETFVGDRR